MNPQEAKEFVRRKVIECVPSILETKKRRVEIAEGEFYSDAPQYRYKTYKKAREVRLADVLRTIESKNDMSLDEGTFYFNHGSITLEFRNKETKERTAVVEWSLIKDDSLDNQSPETLVALAEMMR